MPFERALFYHKLSALFTILAGALHGLIALELSGCGSVGEKGGRRRKHTGATAPQCTQTYSFSTLVTDDTAVTGLVFEGAMLMLVLTSIPPIRRALFEVFYYLHILLLLLAAVFGLIHGDFILFDLELALTQYAFRRRRTSSGCRVLDSGLAAAIWVSGQISLHSSMTAYLLKL